MSQTISELSILMMLFISLAASTRLIIRVSVAKSINQLVVGHATFPLDKTQTPESGVEVLENGKSIATVNCQVEMVNNLKGFAI